MGILALLWLSLSLDLATLYGWLRHFQRREQAPARPANLDRVVREFARHRHASFNIFAGAQDHA